MVQERPPNAQGNGDDCVVASGRRPEAAKDAPVKVDIILSDNGDTIMAEACSNRKTVTLSGKRWWSSSLQSQREGRSVSRGNGSPAGLLIFERQRWRISRMILPRVCEAFRLTFPWLQETRFGSRPTVSNRKNIGNLVEVPEAFTLCPLGVLSEF